VCIPQNVVAISVGVNKDEESLDGVGNRKPNGWAKHFALGWKDVGVGGAINGMLHTGQ
jgi:hypothetical protein